SFYHIFFHNPFPFLYSPPILKSVSLCTEKGAFLLWKPPFSQGFSYASVYFSLFYCYSLNDIFFSGSTAAVTLILGIIFTVCRTYFIAVCIYIVLVIQSILGSRIVVHHLLIPGSSIFHIALPCIRLGQVIHGPSVLGSDIHSFLQTLDGRVIVPRIYIVDSFIPILLLQRISHLVHDSVIDALPFYRKIIRIYLCNGIGCVGKIPLLIFIPGF